MDDIRERELYERHADPVDRISRICDDGSGDKLTRIAIVLGFATPQGVEPTAPGADRKCVITIWNREFDVVPYYRANGFKVLPENLTLNGGQIKRIGGVDGDRTLIRQSDQRVIGDTETIVVNPGDDFDAIPPAHY
jgi:hypothetical protein